MIHPPTRSATESWPVRAGEHPGPRPGVLARPHRAGWLRLVVARAAVPLGLYLVAAALLLVRIGAHPAFPYNWEDATGREFFAFWDHPSLAIFQITQGLMTDSGDSPLLVLPGWLAWQWAGASLEALRIAAALWAAGAVPLLWTLGRRLAGRREAALAAALLALSPVFLLYGRTATIVGLSLTPALATVYVLVNALEPRAPWPWLVALPVLLTLDSYAYAPIRFLWILSLGLLALAWWRRRAERRRILLTLLLTLLLLPTTLAWLERDTDGSLVDLLEEYYNGRGEQVAAIVTYPAEYVARLRGPAAAPPGNVARVSWELAGQMVGQNATAYARLLLDWDTRPALTDYWSPRGRLYPVFLVPLFLAGLGAMARRRGRRPGDAYVLLFFLAFGLPLLLTSQVHIGRLIFALPFLCLLVARGAGAVAGGVTVLLARVPGPAGWWRTVGRRLPVAGALLLLSGVAWTTWVDYSPLPPVSADAQAAADLRAAAAGLPPGAGVALVLGGAAEMELETVQAGGWRLQLNAVYRFVDLAAGQAQPPAGADARPPLYFGGLLDVLAHPAQLPGLCDNVYYVAPAVQARFDAVAAAATGRCGRALRTRPLVQ